jgi:hypothetical protein
MDGCVYVKEGEPGDDYCFKRAPQVESANVLCEAHLSENPTSQSIDILYLSEQLIAEHRIAGDPSTTATSESETKDPTGPSKSLDSSATTTNLLTTIHASTTTQPPLSHGLPIEWCDSAIAARGWEPVLASSPICCFCHSCRQGAHPEVLSHCKIRLLSPIVKGEHGNKGGF